MDTQDIMRGAWDECPGEEEGEEQAELAAATMPGVESMAVSPAGATNT